MTDFALFPQVNGSWDVKFTVTTTSLSKITDFKDQCATTDAYLIFYDTTSPQTVAIYDSFIKEIIRTKNKAVRVVGINPATTKSSVRRKSVKSRSITSGWGVFHQTIQNKRDNETEVRSLYRDIATELMKDRGLITSKPTQRMIGGGLCCFC